MNGARINMPQSYLAGLDPILTIKFYDFKYMIFHIYGDMTEDFDKHSKCMYESEDILYEDLC